MRLDPDYPMVFRFFPNWITDTVLEYRGYALILPWAVFLVWLLPEYVVWPLIALWGILAWIRAGYYRSNILFWERCYEESPDKMRVRTQYVEKMLFDLWRRYQENDGKTWADYEPEITRAMRLIDAIAASGEPTLSFKE